MKRIVVDTNVLVAAIRSRRSASYALLQRVDTGRFQHTVLEVAVNGACDTVVTHNVRDFAAARPLGVLALTPAEFLSCLEESRP